MTTIESTPTAAPANSGGVSTNDVAAVATTYAFQRAAFAHAPNPSPAERREHLSRLIALVMENQGEIAEAISRDFLYRTPRETRALEFVPSILNLKHSRAHLAAWMKREKKAGNKWTNPGTAHVEWQPLGVVGVIVPWNYPLYLALGPLTSALAAGNRVIIKMSEATPHFGSLFQQLIAERFDRSHVAVLNGDVDVAKAVASLPLDHLLFTGSTAVGRSVMKAAAENLTPVTLELGGKSPAIVGAGMAVETAAARIAYGKFLNAGQTCVAPDYALVPADRVEAFVAALGKTFTRLYPAGALGADFTRIIDERHSKRLAGLIDDARSKGARILSLDATASDAATHVVTPTLVLDPTDDMLVMKEEIFGPILPIVTYETLDEAIRFVNARPRPLALYLFDRDGESIKHVLSSTISGGAAVNETIFHLLQDNLPFGGIGPSGMGAYHGKDGFATFSHKKGVFVQSNLLRGATLLEPPYSKISDFVVDLMLRF